MAEHKYHTVNQAKLLTQNVYSASHLTAAPSSDWHKHLEADNNKSPVQQRYIYWT